MTSGTKPAQASLLPPPSLDGLTYHPELISSRDEAALIDRLSSLDLRPFEFHGWTGKRLVASFGWRYDFSDASFRAADPIPEYLLPLRARAAGLANVAATDFEQVLLTRYDPGAGIGWHRDRPVFEKVVGVSLAAPCTLRFRRRVAGRYQRFSLVAEARSAYLLTGAARHQWEHSIPGVGALRFSVTFRTLNREHARR